jgi:hypothetical protein
MVRNPRKKGTPTRLAGWLAAGNGEHLENHKANVKSDPADLGLIPQLSGGLVNITSFVLEKYFFAERRKGNRQCWWGEVESWINKIWHQKNNNQGCDT